ncbi:MAG: hypothetical protein SGPRY_004391, partial [Prymnesium sp.]
MLFLGALASANTPCPPETIFTRPTGNFSLGPIQTGPDALKCHYVWTAGSVGLTLRVSGFSVGDTCRDNDAEVRIYDGSTQLSPVIAIFCNDSRTVATSTGFVLLSFNLPRVQPPLPRVDLPGRLLALERCPRSQASGFTVTWALSEGRCGNGICEPGVHDEYDTCPMDCQQELPPFDEQFSDRKWCAQYDTLTADAGGGDSMEIEYTLAHFGTKLPETGLSLPLATVSPGDACGPITSVMQSSPFHLASLAALTDLAGMPVAVPDFAALVTIYSCHFLDKALHVENIGGDLMVVMYSSLQLFYMAAANERRAEERALDIPSVLIGDSGSDFISSHLAGLTSHQLTLVIVELWLLVFPCHIGTQGVRLNVGMNQRCAGGKLLTATQGEFQSNPVGVNYCSWQVHSWFDLECIVGVNGAYDFVKIYDGATASSAQLALFYCDNVNTVVSSGDNLLFHFYADDLYNFEGFHATYMSGWEFCAPIADCDQCSAKSICNCCMPATGPKAMCADHDWPLNSTCCPRGFAGTFCDRCAIDHYGLTCETCNCSSVGGICSNGLKGDGSSHISSPVIFTPYRHNPPQSHVIVIPSFTPRALDASVWEVQGFWGSQCEPCSCGNTSSCNDGLAGTGCVCFEDHFGPNCEPCDCVGAEQCEDGEGPEWSSLEGDGNCSCAPGFWGSGCFECSFNHFGPTCQTCDCPPHSFCLQGIQGTGDCRCGDAGCEEDPSISFLQLIVAEFLDNPAPTPLERFPLKSSTAFTPSSFDGSPQYNYSSPSSVDTIDILFASPPWNSQVWLTKQDEQTAHLLCAFELQPHNQASPESDLGILNSEALSVLAASSSRPSPAEDTEVLIRTCRFKVGLGNNMLQIKTVSPSGLVRGEYNLQVHRPLSDDCSGIELLALSTHGRRCAGKYNPEGLSDHSCARESYLRVSFNGALSAPSPDSAHDLLSPPPGRSHGALLVTSESGSASCAYNFSVARGLSSNAALAEITLRLQGAGITLSQAFSAPSNSTAVAGIIEWELRA